MAKGGIIFRYKKSWILRHWEKPLFLFILVTFVVLIPGQNVYTRLLPKGVAGLRPLPFPMPTSAPYPVNTTGIYPGTEISAQGVVILDVDSRVSLYKRNDGVPFSPASTTKILTALVALEAYQLEDVLTVKTVMNTGQTMGLVPGERITAENLLFGTLVQSGNDAAWALAENYPGGVPAFVAAMNKKAAEIKLANSHFTNPVGYDDSNHKMTPADLARLAAYALSNPNVAKIVAIPQITISDVTHTYFHSLRNVNQLLGKIPGVGGIKTGWTEEAGENLVTLVERNGYKVIIVLLKSKDRFGETARLIDWVFANYVWQQFSPSR